VVDPFEHENLKKGRTVRIRGHGTKLRRDIRSRPTNDQNRSHRTDSNFVLPDVLACMFCSGLHPGDVTHRVVGFGEAADAMTDPGGPNEKMTHAPGLTANLN
jgi:hypothetical protein